MMDVTISSFPSSKVHTIRNNTTKINITTLAEINY